MEQFMVEECMRNKAANIYGKPYNSKDFFQTAPDPRGFNG